MLYILEFTEIEKEVIWGGNSLASLYSKPFSKDKAIGESWEVADLKVEKSIIKNGEYKDRSLSSLIEEFGLDLLGSNCETFVREKYFPLLIKLIDAKDKLSIQVHPDEEYAQKRHNKHGKSEMWYVMEASEKSKLLIGMKEDVSKSTLEKAISNKENIENMFNYFDVKKGDAFYIPTGCIHAILGDVVIAEIQTPSDVTYRLYDWNRVDKNGNSRELHLEDSFNVIRDINAFDLRSKRVEKIKDNNITVTEIFSNEFFTTEEYNIINNYSSTTNGDSFEIIMVMDGNGSIKSSVENNIIDLYKGKTVFIPAKLGKYDIEGDIKYLRVTV